MYEGPHLVCMYIYDQQKIHIDHSTLYTLGKNYTGSQQLSSPGSC
jgi:hypothetical protein